MNIIAKQQICTNKPAGTQRRNIMEQRVAYFVKESITNENGEYIPCIAKENEQGYYKTDWTWGTNFEIAEECANDKNEMLGLSRNDINDIIASTL